MKLTWKSRTLIEVRWPWMSKKKHEQESTVADAVITNLQDSIKTLTQRHAEAIASLNTKHLKDVIDIRERESTITREALKQIRNFTIIGHRNEDEPLFVIQAVVDRRQCMWMDSPRDSELITQRIIGDLCHNLSDQLRVMARGRGIQQLMMDMDGQHNREQAAQYRRVREDIYNPITYKKQPNP